MKELFLKWAVPFVCGVLATSIIALFAKVKAIGTGLQCLLRADIIRYHDKYTERGFCPIYAKEALSKAYSAYHTLKGNDVATALYNDVMALPVESPNISTHS